MGAHPRVALVGGRALAAFGLPGAGRRLPRPCWLKEGAPADLVVYDFENLRELPTERAWDYPAGAWRLVKKAEGYRYTIVNGEVTFEDGVGTGATPGILLRHGANV